MGILCLSTANFQPGHFPGILKAGGRKDPGQREGKSSKQGKLGAFRLLKVTINDSSLKYVGDFIPVNAQAGAVKYKRQTTILLQPDEKKGRRGGNLNRLMAGL